MSDIFTSVSNKYKNSPSVIVVFAASVLMLVIGLNHFAEDTYSSYLGLKGLESAFGMNVQIFDWSYWTMSLAPQIASIVFFYVYLSDTENSGWALWVSLLAQAIDFFADVWYRSNGTLFDNGKVSIISILITFGYFTLGSEVFVTIGSGLVLKLYAPAMANWKSFIGELKKIKKQFKSNSSGDTSTLNSQKSKYTPKHKPQHMMQKPSFQQPIRKPNQEPTYHPIKMSGDDKLQKPPWG